MPGLNFDSRGVYFSQTWTFMIWLLFLVNTNWRIRVQLTLNFAEIKNFTSGLRLKTIRTKTFRSGLIFPDRQQSGPHGHCSEANQSSLGPDSFGTAVLLFRVRHPEKNQPSLKFLVWLNQKSSQTWNVQFGWIENPAKSEISSLAGLKKSSQTWNFRFGWIKIQPNLKFPVWSN